MSVSVRIALSTIEARNSRAAGEVGRGNVCKMCKAITAPPKRSVRYPRAESRCLEAAMRSEREETDSCSLREETVRLSLATLARAIS